MPPPGGLRTSHEGEEERRAWALIHPPPAARCSAARPTACSEAGPCLPRGGQEDFGEAHARLAEARRVLAEQLAKVPAHEDFDEARKLLAVGALPRAVCPCASLGRTDTHAAAVGSLTVVSERVFLSLLSPPPLVLSGHAASLTPY